jgi:hypothetical protein
MKRRITAGLIASAACLMFAAQVANVRGQGNSGQSEVQRGFDIAPVPLNLDGKYRSLVGLGSYYVNGVSDCIGCHTANEGQYLGGGVPFGPVLSRNLTPDHAGLPAGLTLDQFKDVLHFGTDFKGLDPPGPLIVMPWPAYRHGTDRWMEAMYEYLKAIPCVEGGPGYTLPRC